MRYEKRASAWALKSVVKAPNPGSAEIPLCKSFDFIASRVRPLTASRQVIRMSRNPPEHVQPLRVDA